MGDSEESEELALAISADRSGTGPATWGQKAIWDAVSALGDEAPRYNVSVGFPLGPLYPRQAVLDALTHAARQHEGLRTRLRPSPDGELEQILDASGTIPVLIRRCASEETARVGGELIQEMAGRAFDCAVDWPIRVGLVESEGLVRHYTMVLSHTTADGGGLRRLARDVLMLLEGTGPEQLSKLYPATQPLDEAAYQNSDRGRRRDAASRRHWRTKLTEGPRRMFAPRTERDPDAPYPYVVLSSPALVRSVDHVAAVRQASASSVLLAAATREISRLSGSPEVQFQVVVNNRFLPGMAQTITTLAQEGMFHLRSVDEDFPELLRRTYAGALSAYRHASYDKRLLDRDIERLRAELPELADHSCFLNDTREPELFRSAAPDAELLPLERAREQSALVWHEDVPPRRNQTLALDVVDAPGAVELVMVADSSFIPRADMESFLLGIEETIVLDALATGCV